MGDVCLLLKPNNSTPYSGAALLTSDSADADHGATGVAGANTITIGAHEDISSIKYGDADTQCDWIVVAAGLWRILSVSGQVITIDGTIGTAFTNVVWNTYKSVPAWCKWTDPTTITYFKLDCKDPVASRWNPNLKLTKYANMGRVIIALKKFDHSSVFKNVYAGNLVTTSATITANQAAQLNQALDYIVKKWPDTSPKYSVMYWYNNLGFKTASRDVWDTSTSARRTQRGVITDFSENEDFNNNLTFDSISIDWI